MFFLCSLQLPPFTTAEDRGFLSEEVEPKLWTQGHWAELREGDYLKKSSNMEHRSKWAKIKVRSKETETIQGAEEICMKQEQGSLREEYPKNKGRNLEIQ